MMENKGGWRWEHFFLFMGIGTLMLFLSFSLFPSIFSPYNPKEMFKSWQGISSQHLLGTNDMGYDIFSEVIYAASSTLSVGIAAAFFSLVIGTALGILAGYLSGWRGEIINMIINVFLLIPMLPMTIVVAAYLGPGTRNIILTIAVLGWCATAKIVRAKTRQLKQTSFVESLLILGIPRGQIMFRHILPNLTEVVLARYIMSVSNCILMEASLSFIGFGDPVKVTWGGMINLAYKRGGFAKGAVNWFLAPGICITLCVLAFYCINYYFERQASLVEGGKKSYME